MFRRLRACESEHCQTNKSEVPDMKQHITSAKGKAKTFVEVLDNVVQGARDTLCVNHCPNVIINKFPEASAKERKPLENFLRIS